MSERKVAVIAFAIFALYALVSTLDWHWRVKPEAKPRPVFRGSAAETPAPQCRLVKNGRPYNGWVLTQADSGKPKGGCLYPKEKL